jgi:probable rRNA maturation factor
VNEVEVASAGVEPPPWCSRLVRFACRVLEARGIENWELSILLCDDETIRELNRKYRHLDAVTDVLSFSQREEAGLAPVPSPAGAPPEARRSAGDVVISLETLRDNAATGGVSEEEELKRLVIHGILHLEGLDHAGEDSEMLGLQEEILSSLAKERVL